MMSVTTRPPPEFRRSPNRHDPVLQDQQGRPVRFFADLLSRRRVLIHATYSGCTDTCPPAIHHLVQARQLLGPQGHSLGFASITLTPLDDTPKRLRDLAARFELPPDWTLLTGHPREVEETLALLGLGAWSPTSDDSLRHLAMARLCDIRRIRWAHINLLLKPRSIARMIRYEMA
jgi:protein SCO1/2